MNRPPLMIFMNHSSSDFALLSVLSPVVITKCSGEPVTGAPRNALTRSTSEIPPWTVNASCGRHACLFAADDLRLVDESEAVLVHLAAVAPRNDVVDGVHAEEAGDLDVVAGLLFQLPYDRVVGVLAVVHAAAGEDQLVAAGRCG